MNVVLMDDELVLRYPRVEDFEYYIEWWQDREANYLDNGNYNTINDKKILKKLRQLILAGKIEGWFTICVANKPVGYISYRNINYYHLDGEIAIRLGRQHWGKGYGKRSIKLLLNYMVKSLELKSVWLEVFDYNISAISLYKSTNFKYASERTQKDKKIIKMIYRPD